MIVEIIIMPIYDFKLGGNLTYPYWLAMRTLMYTIAIPVNIMIIYPIYKIVAPSMKYDYTVNSSESLKVKLKYE
jgi:ABC-type maltose transport system permease subunit